MCLVVIVVDYIYVALYHDTVMYHGKAMCTTHMGGF